MKSGTAVSYRLVCRLSTTETTIFIIIFLLDKLPANWNSESKIPTNTTMKIIVKPLAAKEFDLEVS